MSRESTDDMKKRLLDDPEVHWMISRRAYEIYQMRAGQGGSAMDDWFLAEDEVLAFLIEEEGRRPAEATQGSSPETVAGVELAPRTAEHAEPETSAGAWSATEPAGLELAPAPGGEAAMQGPQKTRSRSASKTSTPRAKKSGDSTAKKTAAARPAPRKSADATDKPKRSRKKAETPTATSE